MSEQFDIPPNINQELERLHELILSSEHISFKEMALKNIERIHELLFTFKLTVKDELK